MCTNKHQDFFNIPTATKSIFKKYKSSYLATYLYVNTSLKLGQFSRKILITKTGSRKKQESQIKQIKLNP